MGLQRRPMHVPLKTADPEYLCQQCTKITLKMEEERHKSPAFTSPGVFLVSRCLAKQPPVSERTPGAASWENLRSRQPAVQHHRQLGRGAVPWGRIECCNDFTFALDFISVELQTNRHQTKCPALPALLLTMYRSAAEGLVPQRLRRKLPGIHRSNRHRHHPSRYRPAEVFVLRV